MASAKKRGELTEERELNKSTLFSVYSFISLCLGLGNLIYGFEILPWFLLRPDFAWEAKYSVLFRMCVVDVTTFGRRCATRLRYGRQRTDVSIPVEERAPCIHHSVRNSFDYRIVSCWNRICPALRMKWCIKFCIPLTAPSLKNGVFWDVTPCGSCKDRRFEGT
jgi:hypothetical protein